MRHFVVLGHDAPTGADFALDNLPGGAGRLDLLARSLIATLLHSHDIREDTKLHLVLADELTLTFAGASLRSLHPDERSAAALIRSALEHSEEPVGRVAVEPSPGIALRRIGFEHTMERLVDQGTVLPLQPDGRPVVNVEPPRDSVFVLSDHRNFTEQDREVLSTTGDEAVSLSPRALHTDQAITVAHNWLDTEGFTRY